MNGLAFVFINYVQAARCGHVGWGFLLEEQTETYYFGSTDHLLKDPWWDLIGWLRYAHVEPAGHNDWWCETGNKARMFEMMHTGHHIRYHAAKIIQVTKPAPQLAFEKAESLKQAGWSLLINNCVHQTYSVLSDYGAALPAPAAPVTNLVPKRWFSEIQGEYIDLAKP
jgi:hypothetical protein